MTRAELIAKRDSLGKFYHQCYLSKGVWTRPWTRETLGQWWNCERGPRKFRRFLEPLLPFPIKGATILDIGTNCGAFLFWADRRGALCCTGIEADPRYLAQAKFLRDVYDRQGIAFLYGDALDVVQHNMGWWQAHPFTYAFLNAVIYHVAPEKRVPLLESVGACSQYVVIQGNGLDPNQPDGRGFWSMAHLVLDAGLKVVNWSCEDHCRGAVIVARKP